MNSLKKDLDILFERNLKWRLLKRAFSSAEGIKVLVNIFRYYDLSGSGKINKDNWISALLNNGLLIGITKDQLSNIFDKYKEENTELIDYKKFAFHLFFTPNKISLRKNNINDYNNLYQKTEDEINNSKKYNNNVFLSINESNPVNKGQNFNNFNKYYGKNPNINNSFPIRNENMNSKQFENVRYNNININKRFRNQNLNKSIPRIDYNCAHVNSMKNATNVFRNRIHLNNGLNYYRFISQLKFKCSEDGTVPKSFLPIALQNIGVFYTQNELQNFFYALGCQEITINNVPFSTIIELIKEDLSEERQNIIKNTYNNLCKFKNSDSITINDLKELYKPEMHPEVLNNKRTPNEIYMQFVETLELFAKINNINNNITIEQFVDYYSGISPCYYNDSYFERIINNVWSIQTNNNINNNINNVNKNINNNINNNNFGNNNLNNNSIQKSRSMSRMNYDKLDINNFNINYGQNEKKTLEANNYCNNNIINNNINKVNKENFFNSNAKINLPLFYYNKKANRPNMRGVSLSTDFPRNNDFYQNRNRNITFDFQENPKYLYENTEQNILNKSHDIYGKLSNRKNRNNLLDKDLNCITSTNETKVNNSIISPIIEKLREIFVLQGIKSIFYFQRMLYVYDINHTGEISLINLQNIIGTYNYNFSKEEIMTLFNFYDRENNGVIKYNYLFMEIVGNMDIMRYSLVKQLFDAFPKNQKGNIDIDVVKKSFYPHKHFDVINGKKTSDEVYREFLELIDIFKEYSSNLNGSLSRTEMTYEEFCDFFGEISIEIPNENSFTNLIQNCWKF